MRRNLIKTIGTSFLALSIVLVMTCNLVFAQDKSEDLGLETNIKNSEGIGGNLDGTWDVVVTIRNCQTDVPIRSIPEINTFMFGGTMINSTAGLPPSRRTTGQGVWSQSRGNTFNFSYKAFSFDANNVLTGWVIVRQYLALYGSAYSSRGRVEFYDANGNLLSLGCSTTTATRFE